MKSHRKLILSDHDVSTEATACAHSNGTIRSATQDKTMSVDGLRCILYARIYILYMHTILYYYVQTGRPPVPISSELKLKTNSAVYCIQ